MVCLQCSLYYSRRFCVKCVRKYRDEFPKQLEKEIEDLSAQMSEAIGSVDHIPSRSDYLNMKEDLSFREVSTACELYILLLASY